MWAASLTSHGEGESTVITVNRGRYGQVELRRHGDASGLKLSAKVDIITRIVEDAYLELEDMARFNGVGERANTEQSENRIRAGALSPSRHAKMAAEEKEILSAF